MEIFRIASALQRPDTFPAVLATLVSIEGSSYRRTGARLLWTQQGARIGSISGGCLESDLVAQAQILINSEARTHLATYDTTSENDLVWGVGTGCHGIVRILLERVDSPPAWTQRVLETQTARRTSQLFVTWSADPKRASGTHHDQPPEGNTTVLTCVVTPPQRVVVCGAGDDVRPLTELCHSLGWSVEVIDPRPAMATPTRFPAADSVRCIPAESTATAVLWDDHTVAVIMTHHYRYDLPLLQTLGPLNLPYLGLLGPKQRGERICRDAGLNDLSAIHSPLGLDLGGDGAEAVALSIVAEIQATLHRRSAANLSARERSIHAD